MSEREYNLVEHHQVYPGGLQGVRQLAQVLRARRSSFVITNSRRLTEPLERPVHALHRGADVHVLFQLADAGSRAAKNVTE